MEAFALARVYKAWGDKTKSETHPWYKRPPKPTTYTSLLAKHNQSVYPTTPQPAIVPPIPNIQNTSNKFLLLLGTDDPVIDHFEPDVVIVEEPMEETIVEGDISSLNDLAGHGNPRSLRLLCEVALTMQGHLFHINLHVLPIEGPNVVLGIQCFVWSSLAASAFSSLKDAMVAASVLRLPNFQLEFVIETDAFNVSIGAMLMQTDHPIAYFNKKLGPQMRIASTYIKELHAIVEAVHK
ncbi:hypothetical protein JRO89_XS09G0200500 [Xanthoceras sorbifolium]|uniref:Reverse transcriptase/retrotransposon-derived protein RNase H-like domain-containing protein n=1 Tax=Xanthoceras sorbifolium TaxID=99658 RepID=A0ABQ8HM08_9ROSI|nr:hypothetical protein JRO89_XS09G0200500 [Xanthoceras sorbifolium]